MKVAPVMQALSSYEDLCQTLVHTGQHYDRNMSEVILRKLSLPAPEVSLAVRSGSQAQQTVTIMQRFEPFVLERKSDLVLVYGDVNSTIAAALVCSKVLFPVCYVERPPRIPALFRPDLFGGSFLGESRKQSQYSVPFSSRHHRSYAETDKLTAA